jgi:hypothetical protein
MWDTLYIGVPEGTSWPLDLDTAEAQLRERSSLRRFDSASGRVAFYSGPDGGGCRNRGIGRIPTVNSP